MNKVALIGTSCVGKSTLVRYFEERIGDYPGLGLVPEAARDFFIENEDLREVERFSATVQRRVQALALERERTAAAAGHSSLLCDGSVLDAVVYTIGYGDEPGGLELLASVEGWLSTYTRFVLLDPAGVPFENDATRVEAQLLRDQFHRAFLQFLSASDLPWVLVGGTLESRVAIVAELLTAGGRDGGSRRGSSG